MLADLELAAKYGCLKLNWRILVIWFMMSFVKSSIKLNWQAYLAEFIGTFVFVFVSSGAVLANVFTGDIGAVGISLASGLILASMIYSTTGISGGHLNPAVTLAIWLTEGISFINAIFYISFQFLASIAAAFLLLFVFGQKSTQFLLGGPIIGANVTIQSAIILEAILTAVLVFSVFAIFIDRRGPVSFGPLVIGLVVLSAGIVGGSLSGAVLNPARALGPLMVSGAYDSILVWVIGPFTGSLIGVFYKFLFLTASKKGR